MADQELTSLKLTFKSDIKKTDIDNANLLADVFERLDKLKVNDTLSPYLKNLSSAMSGFKGISIRATLGKSIAQLTEALNGIENVKDISPYTENLKRGFSALSEASKHFEGTNLKIPVGLGRGITGLVTASNQITEVKDISSHAQVLNRNFQVISEATRNFDNMNNSDYTGISRLVNAMSNVGKIKPINDNVVKNAHKLAEAINILDKETNSNTSRLESLATVTKNVGNAFNQSTRGVNNFGGSLKLLNLDVIIRGIKSVTSYLSKMIRQLYSTVDAYGEVQNTMSFFSQSLGENANATASVIQSYADLGIVDFTQFADQTAKLNQIYKGYGFAAEDAAKMALNLTQIAYDGSYALGQNGKDIQKYFNIVDSIAAGNTRAARGLGVDIGISSLADDFDGLTNASDRQTKALAAYEKVLSSTTAIQGQLSREINTSYVQMQVFKNRINQLKQSIGQALVPMFEVIIQWGLVALKVLERLIGAIARLFGGEFKLINYADMIKDMGSGMSSVGSATKDMADGLKDSTKNAKELKKTISGIDQVFTINDEKPSSSGSGGGISGIGGLGGGVSGYDFLDDVALEKNKLALEKIEEQTDKAIKAIQKGIPIVAAFGAALVAWKISKSFLNTLKWIDGLKNIFGGLGFDKLTFGLGFLLFIDNLEKFRKAVADIIADKPNFDNVSRIISSFTGLVGSIALMTGNVKIAGVLFVVQGVVDVVNAIKKIDEKGFKWENVSEAIDAVANIAIGVGLLTGNWATVGLGFAVKGILGLIDNIGQVIKAIKTGDWSGLDYIDVFKNVLMVVGGLLVALKLFQVKNPLKSAVETSEVSETIGKVSETTGQSTAKLATMAKNLAWGALIMAEVVLIGTIFVGGIALIGLLLQQVIKAWKPVLADGDTAAIAIGLGTVVLVAVGGVAYLLGKATVKGGSTIPLAIAAGAGMLLLIEVSAIAFIASIVVIGKLLDELGKAWQPVLANGSTITAGIALGTALLITIGAASFALGTATVASAGTIPLAIGVGTAMLALLTVAVVSFIKEMKLIADQLANHLAPSLARLNEIMPNLSEHMRVYTFFMLEFAGHVVAQTASNLLSGLSATIDTIVSWFTKDPIKAMADDANKNIKQFTALNNALSTVNPLVKKGNDGMKLYIDLLNQLHENAKKAGSLGSISSVGVNFKDFSKALKDGFKDLESIKTSNVANIMSALSSIDLNKFKGIGTSIVKSMELGMTTYVFSLTSVTTKIKTGLTFSATSIGTNIARDVVNGINNISVNLATFSNKIKNGLTFNGTSIGSGIARNVISGINGSSAGLATFSNRIKNGLNISTYSIGSDIARGVQNGINGFWPNTTLFTNRLKRGMQVSFQIYSPSRWGRDFIGANLGIGVVDGVNETKIDFNPFKRNISDEMYGIMEEVDVTPIINMPTIDTSRMNGDISNITRDLTAKVSSQYEYTNDGTEKAVQIMTEVIDDKLEKLIQETKDGKKLYVDGEKIGEISERHTRANAVRLNTVFGK